MRTIKELLIIMRDKGSIFNAQGLCVLAAVLYYITGDITFNEAIIIRDYIYNNRPSFKSPLCRKADRYSERSDSAYYWKLYAWEPRLRWLNYHIKKLSKDEKP